MGKIKPITKEWDGRMSTFVRPIAIGREMTKEEVKAYWKGKKKPYLNKKLLSS
jgi:hypothetical protein